MATAAHLPYQVTPFKNESGTTSYRVSGSWKGKRTRENHPDRATADAVCNAKNAEVIRDEGARKVYVVQTHLTEDQVHEAEGVFNRLGNRWKLQEVVDAGVAALDSRPTARLVAPLAEEWLLLIEDEVATRWLADLRKAVRQFVAENPGITTAQWDRALTRKWLDGLALANQTKANLRNRLHRFCVWLIESGHIRENPTAGIRISSRASGAKQADKALPSILTPRQAQALLHACQLGACRRVLGWASACLFVGLRPESEAPRATWAEVKVETAEWSVMGRKRGAKPRIIPLQPTAIAWLKVVKADAMEQPAVFSRRLKRRAVELANAWLAEHHPKDKAIMWDEDITRHTFASYRSAQIPVHELAEEMGTSPSMIYSHYRNPRPAAAVAQFWALMPKA